VGPVEFAGVGDAPCIARLTGLPVGDVIDAVEGGATSQNNVGHRLLETPEVELGLAFLAESAYQGVPWAVANFTWHCLMTDQFERGRNLFAVAAQPCELFVWANSENEESESLLLEQWANCRSNDALCSLAMQEDPNYALEVWADGAATGHPESNFYPAVVYWRQGQEQRSMEHLGQLDAELIDESRQILLEGAASQSGWFARWCEEGTAVLEVFEKQGAAHVSGELLGMDFCKDCGTQRQPDHKFCGACGGQFN
jgi:hypothetical protein